MKPEQSPSMDSKQVTPRRKRSRLSKWITTFALAVLFCPIFLFLGLGVWRNSVQRENARHISAIQAAGHPVHPSELTNWFASVPKDKNAAAVYVQAFAALVHPARVGARFHPWAPPYPPHTAPLSNEIRRMFESVMATNQTALGLLHEAASRERCAFYVNLDTVISYSPPHLSFLRRAAGVLEIEGVLHAEAGRADESFQSYRAMMAAARSLDGEPLLESLRTRARLLARTTRLVQRMVDRLRLSDGQLKQISSDLWHAETNNLLPRALAADRAIHLPLFDLSLDQVDRLLAPRRGDKPEAETDSEGNRIDSVGDGMFRLAGLMALDQRLYLRLTDANLVAAQLPFPSALDRAESANAQLTNSSLFSSMLSHQFLGSMEGEFISEAGTHAVLRCAQTAVAIERYRLSHGDRIPATLAALVPDFLQRVPEDPFNGKPLRYQIRTNGYCVYSVGRDRTDDGGREFYKNPKERKATGYSHDDTFEVSR